MAQRMRPIGLFTNRLQQKRNKLWNQTFDHILFDLTSRVLQNFDRSLRSLRHEEVVECICPEEHLGAGARDGLFASGTISEMFPVQMPESVSAEGRKPLF
jgi:hypothetical protein